ncbi:hypothetical protein P154DRAFT_442174, partial [Amniculicola lignicola CBS 123094]
DGGVLEFQWPYSIEDPVESENRIYNHRDIVHPHLFVSQCLAEEAMLGFRIPKAPVHDDIPYTAVDCIYCGERNEDGTILVGPIDTVDT